MASGEVDADRQGGTHDLVTRRWTDPRVMYLRAWLGRSERGASLVEYALLVALIAVVCIGAVAFLGGKASSKFSDVGSSLGP